MQTVFEELKSNLDDQFHKEMDILKLKYNVRKFTHFTIKYSLYVRQHIFIESNISSTFHYSFFQINSNDLEQGKGDNDAVKKIVHKFMKIEGKPSI